MQRIIGIDIGLRFTGYGIVDFIGQKELIVEGGVIKTDSSDDLHIRLGSIFEDLNQKLSIDIGSRWATAAALDGPMASIPL